MFKLIEKKSIFLTPDIARYYLQYNDYPAQRKARRNHIIELQNLILNGKFHEGRIAVGILNDITYLVDGQHICYSIIEASQKNNNILGVEAQFHKNICYSEKDLADLYCQYDNLTRSMRDKVKAKHFFMGIKRWPEWLSRLIISAAAIENRVGDRWRFSRLNTGGNMGGVQTGSEHTTKNPMTANQKMNLLDSYMVEAEFIADLFSNTDLVVMDKDKLRHVARTIVVFLIFQTFRISKEDTIKFWSRVISGENLTHDDPEFALRDFLVGLYGKKIQNHEIAYKIVLAWNSFRSLSIKRFKYYKDGAIPELI